LDFGRLVDHYDAGRVPHNPLFVQRTADRLQVAVSARRLQVGAGTCQLTGALLAAGGDLVAVEPSGPMAERLWLNRAADVKTGRLQLSYAQIAALTTDQRDELAAGIRGVIHQASTNVAAGKRILAPPISSKLVMRVRFPSPAPTRIRSSEP
jgi:16S rRNA A1518/A1519 N6-dimethyltransferase RsmA/KsgA/DIM1 with predicted DNA glycosylase/AP lyase activity